MKSIKLFTYLLLLFITFGLQSCGDDNKDEPTVNDIQGTWLLTNYSTRYHYSLNDSWWDDNTSKDVTESYWYDGMSLEPSKYWEHITFDKSKCNIWLAEYPLPTMPRSAQYDVDTPEGQIQYIQAFEDWQEAIGCMNEGFPWECPYSLKGNKLYIGKIYNGDIEFVGSDSFTLTYKDTAFDKEGEYKLYVYTFKRNS